MVINTYLHGWKKGHTYRFRKQRKYQSNVVLEIHAKRFACQQRGKEQKRREKKKKEKTERNFMNAHNGGTHMSFYIFIYLQHCLYSLKKIDKYFLRFHNIKLRVQRNFLFFLFIFMQMGKNDSNLSSNNIQSFN